jgi:DNA polymerase elongation subunit (family B)
MILERTWNKKDQKLMISYVDKDGNRKFYQKYLHHIKTYEYDENGEYETWNGRRCNAVYKDTTVYTPNEFDILEYLYNLPEDLNKEFHAQYFPKLYTFDIETEISLEFPDPELAKQQVTAISLVGPDLSCIVYGLKDMNEKQRSLFRERYLQWIQDNEFARNFIKDKKEPKVLYQKFNSEDDMLKHFFTIILPKVTALAGWNSNNFDYRYLWNRLVNLFGRGEAYNILRKASPVGELTNLTYKDADGTTIRIPAPGHVTLVDYMEMVKQYDYALRPYESYSLDWVANAAIGAHKIKYDGTLQDLYEKDTEWYYFYNAIDSLLTILIHYRLKSIQSPCAVSAVTLVPLTAATGQIALTTANVFEQFYEDGYKVVYDWNEVERFKIPYEGAFCGAVPGRYGLTVCDDFASLYPSQIRTCNFSFENYMQKTEPNNIPGLPPVKVPWTTEELENFRKDPNYFVSVMGHVYKNDKDYAFRKVQKKLKSLRDRYKYTGQKIDAELLTEIDRLIKDKKK